MCFGRRNTPEKKGKTKENKTRGYSWAPDDLDYGEEFVLPDISEEISAEVKVRGGRPARPIEIPYIVSLQNHTRQHPHFCGASIIHPLILLTAAHCFSGISNRPEGIIAVSGEHQLSAHEGPEQIRNISRLVIHENWNLTTLENDIALLVLDSPLEFNSHTRPIRIPVPNAPLKDTAELSGWGYVKRSGNSADVLQVAKVGFKRACTEWYGEVGLAVTDSMFCAGGARDSCEMDSGGPLACRSRSTGERFQCGIVSWGIQGCYKSGFPGVYTNVSKYHHWITNHLQEILENQPNVRTNKACGAATSFDPAVTCVTCGPTNKAGKSSKNSTLPYIASFRIHADIQHRYSHTKITSVMVNPNKKAPHEVNFSVHLPERAFLSHFSMTIEGIAFNACTEGREAARRKYGGAGKGNQTAKIVQNSHGNLFSVTRSLPPSTIVTIILAYEELVPRRAGWYEQSIHIDTEKVRDARSFEITASVTDSRNITVLRALGLSRDINFDQEIEGADPSLNGNAGTIRWSPDAGKPQTPQRFVLQYDTVADAGAPSGEILIRGGYFAHFFSPGNIPPFEKHLIFLLELSMNSTLLRQLKDGVVQILNGLERRDRFSIILFNDHVTTSLGNGGQAHVKNAKRLINSLKASCGGVHLHGALMKALNLPSVAYLKPIIVLFSSGKATTGLTNQSTIASQVAAANLVKKVPIFSLAFGSTSSDFSFLRKLSLQSSGFARKFYPELDPAQQLSEFYAQMSSLLLVDLNFTYNTVNSPFKASDMTATNFPSYFKGNDIVVVGKLAESTAKDGTNGSEWLEEINGESGSTACVPGQFIATVHGRSKSGWVAIGSSQTLDCKSVLGTSSSFIERLWAYLTIKEILHDSETMNEERRNDMRKGGCEEPWKYANRLAMEYGFVTPVTSLVIIQPGTPNEAVEAPEMNVLAVRAGVHTADHQDDKMPDKIQCITGMEPGPGNPAATESNSWSNGTSGFGGGTPSETDLLSNN